jgi:hypothetical protein
MLSTKAIMSNIESEEHQCPEPSPFPLPQFAFPKAVPCSHCAAFHPDTLAKLCTSPTFPWVVVLPL